MMFSVRTVCPREDGRRPSLSGRLVDLVYRRICRVRRELRGEDQAMVDAARFGKRLESLRNSIEISFSGN